MLLLLLPLQPEHLAVPTDLIGAHQGALDSPSPEALMVGICSGKVTVLGESTARMAANEVDNVVLEPMESAMRLSQIPTSTPSYLAHCGSVHTALLLVTKQCTWQEHG